MAVAGFNPSLGPPSNVHQYVGADGLPVGPRFPAGDPLGRGGQFKGRSSGGGMLLWYGFAVEARIEAAALAAVETIARAAAGHAIANHPWKNLSGETEGSVWVGEPEITYKGIARCPWGADGAALFLEYGTAKMPAYPWLRPAQDATYPHLGGALVVAMA